MIPFNKPLYTGKELLYIEQLLNAQEMQEENQNSFNLKCVEIINEKLGIRNSWLTPSCTSSLEMSCLLLELSQNDEIILPSFTFPSTANAFVLRGARLKFIDIKRETMNIDEKLISRAITPRTKAIVTVHYGGVSCEMDQINEIAKSHNIKVIEDAAHAIGAKYKNRPLGTISDIGCFSLHETKNITCGEGGIITINNPAMIDQANIIRENGTDKIKFMKGEIDRYQWQGLGSNYKMSELQAAYLYAQLIDFEKYSHKRMEHWKYYHRNLKDLENKGVLERPFIPSYCAHNAHTYYIKVANQKVRGELLTYLKEKNVMATSHYVPLHMAPGGQKFGEFIGQDRFTSKESSRLIRLPLFYELNKDNLDVILTHIYRFYQN